MAAFVGRGNLPAPKQDFKDGQGRLNVRAVNVQHHALIS
jgi:hypothetical protein